MGGEKKDFDEQNHREKPQKKQNKAKVAILILFFFVLNVLCIVYKKIFIPSWKPIIECMGNILLPWFLIFLVYFALYKFYIKKLQKNKAALSILFFLISAAIWLFVYIRFGPGLLDLGFSSRQSLYQEYRYPNTEQTLYVYKQFKFTILTRRSPYGAPFTVKRRKGIWPIHTTEFVTNSSSEYRKYLQERQQEWGNPQIYLRHLPKMTVSKVRPNKLEIKNKIEMKQYEHRVIPGSQGWLILHMKNITGNRTSIILYMADGELLLEKFSVSSGKQFPFVFGERHYLLTANSIFDKSWSDKDYGIFYISAAKK